MLLDVLWIGGVVGGKLEFMRIARTERACNCICKYDKKIAALPFEASASLVFLFGIYYS